VLGLGRSGKVQQFVQGGGTGPVHGRAHGHLDGFEIETPGLAPPLENDL
jgi:hypothetical protein